MLKNIEALHAIQSRCAAKLPLPCDMRKWLAQAIKRYLEQDCESLNEAFGLIQDQGGVPWWREHALRERNTALRKLANKHFGSLSVYGRAKAVSDLTIRYGATCWPRDQRLDAMPDRYHGTPKELLWTAFRSKAKMPVSERHLRTLFAD